MPNIGPLELAIVLIIALIIFGPKRLPELGRSLGNGLREFKDSISGKNDEEREEQAKLEVQTSQPQPQPDAEPTEAEPLASKRR
jgi:sec-independent protein translocase protein TatA